MKLTHEQIAMVCHEQNRAYCAATGDNSQVPWDQAPEWQRASAIDGVVNIDIGAVRSPADSHATWLSHKTREGWVHGEEKDPDRKTRPCMVPFADLPPAQRAKDHLFFHTARTLLTLLGA